MPRFYVPDVLSPGRLLALPENVVRHLNVLRVRAQAEIVLFNGNGKAYPARLVLLEKRRAQAEILREERADNESPLRIILVQAVSSGERMDFTLQKSVELG
ncbi:RsmE family RNA methyltransferase, partial [Bacillus stratosphericus]